MADNPLTLEKMLRGSQNLDVWEAATNGDENTDWTNLVGDNGPSLKKAIKLIMQKAPINSTPFATKAALLADTAPADGAFAFVYNDTDDNNGLYQKVSGVWQYQKWNPLAEALAYINKALDGYANISNDEIAFAVKDTGGNTIFIIKNDGSVQGFDANFESINGVSDTPNDAAFAVSDMEGNTVFVVKNDGSVLVDNLVFNKLNGLSATELLSSNTVHFESGFNAELLYFNNTGQSLSEGSNGRITETQEYDNVGFPPLSENPSQYLPLTINNTQAIYGGTIERGESPVYGALGHIKELIQEENGISYTQQNYQLLGVNNGISSTPINDLSKGTRPYNAALSQVQSGFNIAKTENRTFKVGATFWTQGESENNDDTAERYKTALIKLANDFNTDAKAITKQTNDIPLICYLTPTRKTSAIGQLQAHDASPLITVATPIYFLNFYDFWHIDAPSSKILGGYYGMVYKRVVIDGGEWQPLRPIMTHKTGKVLSVRFNSSTLVFDSTTSPLQPNYGFHLLDANNTEITINSVSIINKDTVKIVANTDIPSGAKLEYAFAPQVGKGGFGGGAGNLRDNESDVVIYQNTPLHKWCVNFSMTI